MGWFEFTFVGVGVAVGFLGALAMMLLNPPHDDFKAARALFWLSAILVWAFTVAWEYRSHYAFPVRAGITVVVAAVVAFCLVYVLDLVHKREGAALEVSQSVGRDQAARLRRLQQIEAIDRFLGSKDELGIRAIFDFDNLLKYNILFVKRDMLKSSGLPFPEKESQEIDKYFATGQARIDGRYAHMFRENNAARVKFLPRKIGFINTSEKYVSGRKTLQDLIDSPFTPPSVRPLLKILDETVERDSLLLTQVLNESASADPHNIINNYDDRSPYFSQTSGRYYGMFEDLKPRVDEINAAISAFLDGA